MAIVLLNQVSLKDKKKIQCGDSHKGLLQPPRGSKGRCAEAEGAIEITTYARPPCIRLIFTSDFYFRLTWRVLPPFLFYKLFNNKDMNPHTGNSGFRMFPLVHCTPHTCMWGKMGI